MSLAECTRSSFGDMADTLLDAGAVFPVNSAKTPALGRGVSWKDPTDPNYNWNAWGYAIKTGDVSGITVVDFDNGTTPPGRNVSTLRGSHVWIPSEPSDRNSAGLRSKVDVRGNGGYAVFHSPNHKVITSELNDRHLYASYITTTTNIEYCYDIGVHINDVPLASEYLEAVEARGFKVDLEWVSNRLAAQIRGTKEGRRNNRFYKNAVQVIKLGCSEEQVRRVKNAAYDVGLEPAEIEATFGSARQAKGISPIMQVADRWANNAKSVIKSPVIEELVRLATEQHNTVPLVSKKGLVQSSGIPLSTVKRHLNKMEESGLVEQQINEGYRVEGGRVLSHANNYRLIWF